MSDEEKISFLKQKMLHALNAEDGDISDERTESLRDYRGLPFDRRRDGYSHYVERTVLDTIEWALPPIMRVFAGASPVVAFQASNQEDEAAAEQETDVANYYLTRANNGFMTLYSFIKDALLYPNSYTKVSWREKEIVEVEEYSGLTIDELVALDKDPEREITGQTEHRVYLDVPEMAPGPDGQPVPTGQMVQQPDIRYDVDVKRTFTDKTVEILPCPPEDVLVDSDLTSLNLDDADFVCHRVHRTKTELIQMGFDKKVVEGLKEDREHNFDDEKVHRRFREDEDPHQSGLDDPSMEQVWVNECYVWMDADGDGVAEHRRILFVNDVILEDEETSYQPFVAMAALPMTHKHTGMSLAEIVKDLQRLKSILTRQMLDNLYRFNTRRKYIHESAISADHNTLNAMNNPQSEWIPVRGNPNQAIMMEQAQSVLSEVLPAIQHFEEVQKTRTGVAPSVNLDPSVLQRTAGMAFMSAQEQANQRIELLVRVFAETGIKQMMTKIHSLLRAHQDQPLTLKLRGRWVQVDPTTWNSRHDVEVNVGVGFANKPQQIQMLSALLEIQERLAAQGLARPEHIYHTVEKMIRAADIGDPAQYIADPTQPGWQPPEPPPPDPMMMAQAEVLKAQAEKIGGENRLKELEIQSKERLDTVKIQGDQAKLDADLRKARLETEIKIRQLEIDRLEAEVKAEESRARFGLTPEETAAQIDNIYADTQLKLAQARTQKAEAKNPKASKSNREPK